MALKFYSSNKCSILVLKSLTVWSEHGCIRHWQL